MKYIKKFNEELKTRTYLSASKKLQELGHTDRANKLKDWVKKLEFDEQLVKWKDHLQDFALFGTYKINIENPETGQSLTDDFYLFFNFDELGFEDNFEYEKEKDPKNIKDIGIFFFVGLIPTSQELIQKCEQIMPGPEFDNGFYWGMWVEIKFDIISERVEFKGFEVGDYDENQSGNVSLADRKSAQLFRKTLIDIFSNPNLDYPSGYTNAENIYQKLEQSILSGCGFYSDYGFQLSEVSDYLRKQSVNSIYKTI